MVPISGSSLTEATVPAQAARTASPSAAAMSTPSWVRQSSSVSLYCSWSTEKAATTSPCRGETTTWGSSATTGVSSSGTVTSGMTAGSDSSSGSSRGTVSTTGSCSGRSSAGAEASVSGTAGTAACGSSRSSRKYPPTPAATMHRARTA